MPFDGLRPGRDPMPDMPWWQILGGGLLVAAATFGLIWIFAILGFALEGAAR